MDAEVEGVVEGDRQAHVEHVVAGLVRAHRHAGAQLAVGLEWRRNLDVAGGDDALGADGAVKDEDMAVADVEADAVPCARHAGAKADLVAVDELDAVGRVGDGAGLVEAAGVQLEHPVPQGHRAAEPQADGVDPILGLHDGGQGRRFAGADGEGEVLGGQKHMVVGRPGLVHDGGLDVEADGLFAVAKDVVGAVLQAQAIKRRQYEVGGGGGAVVVDGGEAAVEESRLQHVAKLLDPNRTGGGHGAGELHAGGDLKVADAQQLAGV